MKREEIEQLLADYANGEISPADKKYLEDLFKQDAELKQEADELVAVWQSLNKIEEREQPGAAMDDQFFAMLQNAKAAQQPVKRVVQLNVAWLKTAAAIAACIAAFVIGRVTVSPEKIVSYKTVFVKQPVPHQIDKPELVIAKIQPALNAVTSQTKEGNTDENSPLARQLRSVYTSERIGAVMKITGKGNLNDADLKSLELALKEDPSANLRLTILNALRPMVNRQNVQQVLISALNRQDDELVQTSIVDMLVDAGSKQAIPQMIALLDDKHTNATTQNKIKAGIESFLN